MYSAAVHETQQLQRSQLWRRPLESNGTCPEKERRRRRRKAETSPGTQHQLAISKNSVHTYLNKCFLAIHFYYGNTYYCGVLYVKDRGGVTETRREKDTIYYYNLKFFGSVTTMVMGVKQDGCSSQATTAYMRPAEWSR